MSSHGGFRGGKKLSKANSHTYKAVLTIDQLKPDMNGFNITVMVVKIGTSLLINIIHKFIANVLVYSFSDRYF
jgi:hypothetical protein